MLRKFKNKETGEEVKAIQFTRDSINETVLSVGDQASKIMIEYICGEYSLTAKYIFGNRDYFIAKEGDYIIESDEIPDTLPRLHYFSRMSAQEFDKIFSPFSVNP